MDPAPYVSHRLLQRRLVGGDVPAGALDHARGDEHGDDDGDARPRSSTDDVIQRSLLESQLEQRWLKARHQAWSLIQLSGKRVGFPRTTMATAMVFFHRFYAIRPLTEHPPLVEETVKKCRDLIVACKSVTAPGSQFDGDDESEFIEEYRKRVLLNEKFLLDTINYQFDIRHPYAFMVKLVKRIGGSKELAHKAWQVLNDSHETSCVLHYPPHVIAAASVYIALSMADFAITPDEPERDRQALAGVIEEACPFLLVEDCTLLILELAQYAHDKEFQALRIALNHRQLERKAQERELARHKRHEEQRAQEERRAREEQRERIAEEKPDGKRIQTQLPLDVARPTERTQARSPHGAEADLPNERRRHDRGRDHWREDDERPRQYDQHRSSAAASSSIGRKEMWGSVTSQTAPASRSQPSPAPRSADHRRRRPTEYDDDDEKAAERKRRRHAENEDRMDTDDVRHIDRRPGDTGGRHHTDRRSSVVDARHTDRRPSTDDRRLDRRDRDLHSSRESLGPAREGRSLDASRGDELTSSRESLLSAPPRRDDRRTGRSERRHETGTTLGRGSRNDVDRDRRRHSSDEDGDRARRHHRSRDKDRHRDRHRRRRSPSYDDEYDSTGSSRSRTRSRSRSRHRRRNHGDRSRGTHERRRSRSRDERGDRGVAVLSAPRSTRR